MGCCESTCGEALHNSTWIPDGRLDKKKDLSAGGFFAVVEVKDGKERDSKAVHFPVVPAEGGALGTVGSQSASSSRAPVAPFSPHPRTQPIPEQDETANGFPSNDELPAAAFASNQSRYSQSSRHSTQLPIPDRKVSKGSEREASKDTDVVAFQSEGRDIGFLSPRASLSRCMGLDLPDDRHEPTGQVEEQGSPKPKLQRALTMQAAGHGGLNILKDFEKSEDVQSGIPTYIMKSYCEPEVMAYEALQERKDPLLSFTARYYGEVKQDDQPDKEGERYIRLSNLLRSFARGPHVMDCKLGIRSFAEEEVGKTKPRPDLYKKLVALDPSAVTDRERSDQACTKYRWMSFNDNYTTLRRLGFRVDGIVVPNCNDPITSKELKKLQTLKDIALCISERFLPFAGHADSQQLRLRLELSEKVTGSLRHLKETMEKSAFVRTHSIIGSSLLFVADATQSHAAVFLIDFAKTMPLPPGVTVNHASPWEPGNHEDGIFTGLDNMIACWELVCELVRQELIPEVSE